MVSPCGILETDTQKCSTELKSMPVLQVRDAGRRILDSLAEAHGFTWMNYIHWILNDGVASFLLVFSLFFSMEIVHSIWMFKKLWFSQQLLSLCLQSVWQVTLQPLQEGMFNNISESFNHGKIISLSFSLEILNVQQRIYSFRQWITIPCWQFRKRLFLLHKAKVVERQGHSACCLCLGQFFVFVGLNVLRWQKNQIAKSWSSPSDQTWSDGNFVLFLI